MEKYLEEEMKKDYFISLMDSIKQEYATKEVYPPYDQLFACFKDMEAKDLKVVILGQDPYHQRGQANGLAFSVNRGIKLPPSLKNIYQEMHDDVGCYIPSHGNLTDLKKQGVLLLNNVLSVIDSKPNSHKNIGWQKFMVDTLEYIDTIDQPIVFILWGKEAQSKKKYIHHADRLILESVHPSPLSSYRGFFGSKPFSKANQFLIENGVSPVDWQVKEFDDVNKVISYIESKSNKKTFEEYQAILDRNDIHLRTKNIIHVTGTNGKGSTVHYLSHFLMAANLQVGTFTSPYLVSYHDRFCINGKPIDDETLIRLVNENYELIEREKLSKFEIDVLLMIQYFNSLPLDYAIVEVGVGGKEDKTNVVDSKTQIIVNIGKDHMPRLGTTELEVCEQKAGIIKENSNVYTCVSQSDCLDLIKDVCNKKHCNLTIVDKEAKLDYGNLATYQHLNISLALEVFKGLNIPYTNQMIQDVIDHTFWAGRFERFEYQGHHIIIDGAHNIDGINALMSSLDPSISYTVIFSALRDKDYHLMIHTLESKYQVLVTVFNDERKMTLEDLKEFDHTYASLKDALEACKESENIVITGSLHFISYVRKYLTM